ncbi:PAS domain S-box protein [Methylomonas fluvii]|uniref:PAS domain S-box protein n=1 Tax=Methylomonas fluvii TaxID=1854564 RepID=A0ABR9D8E3_9GAMM|nr:PAS domain S-box protein [Methylomonas fluvii]MBD9359076.1 PAS domain S-box protein [Methylomonas fluvii]
MSNFAHETDLLYGIIDSIKEAVIVFDATHTIICVNRCAELLLGIGSTADWENRHYLFAADGNTPFPVGLLPCFQPVGPGMAEAIELSVRRADGSNVRVSASGRGLPDRHGTISAWLTILSDISLPNNPEKHAEILERQQNLGSVLNHMPAMIGYWDKNLINKFGNKAYEEWFGFTSENLLGKHIREVIGDNLYTLNKPFIDAVLKGEPQYFERTIVNVAGAVRHTQTAYLPDGTVGQVKGFFVLVTDITALKFAQKRVSESEARLRAMYDSLPFLAWMKDKNGKYIQANKHWLNAVGIDHLRDSEDVTDFEIWPEGLAEHYRAVDQEVMLTRQQISLTERAFDAGRETWTETIKAPIVDDKDDVLGTIGLARDITESRSAEERLRNYSERLSLATKAAAIGICEWDLALGVGDWDERMYEMFGIPLGTPIDYQTWEALVVVEDLPRTEATLRKLIRDQQEKHWEFRIRRQSDGVLRFIQASAIIVGDPKSGGQKIVGVNMDVSNFKLIENALRESEAHLANAQAQAHLGSWSLNIRERSLKWSDENYRIFGMPLGTPISYKRFLECVHPADRHYVRRAWQAAMRGAPYDIQHRIVANGKIKWLRERADLAFAGDGSFLRGIGTSQDITELKIIEKDLESSRLQLRQLAARREKAREEERKHMAREVHDELGQMLTALRMEMSLLRMKFAISNRGLAEQVRNIMELLDQTIQVTRDVATSLRPSAIEMGIVPALEWLVRKFAEQSGIQCDLLYPEDDFDMDEECAIVIFRIAQESLTNVLRHAAASQVKIAVNLDKDHYCLKIDDNGRGFDAHAPTKTKSFGLIGIRERSLMLGGETSISSAPGQGTSIQVRIPANPKRPEL